MMDSWNPATFSPEILEILHTHSKLILDYHIEKQEIAAEKASSPYRSSKTHKHARDYINFRDEKLNPALIGTRIRVWHYTRLTDSEVDHIQQELAPTSLKHLLARLKHLHADGLLTDKDVQTLYKNSPLHIQEKERAGKIWTTHIPLPPGESGIEPLLNTWGGESTHACIHEHTALKAKLEEIGSPRIIEMETPLLDCHNIHRISGVALISWAISIAPCETLQEHLITQINQGGDLKVTEGISETTVIRIHTKGEREFNHIATRYPEGAERYLNTF